MSSAVWFNLDQSKILSSGNGLNRSDHTKQVTFFGSILLESRKVVWYPWTNFMKKAGLTLHQTTTFYTSRNSKHLQMTK